MLRITVIGASHGGHAMAGYAALKGNEVILLTSDRKKQEEIERRGTKVTLTGALTGEGKLRKVTTEVSEAVEDRDVIFIVTDAAAHKPYAEKIAPYLTGQDVVLTSPGVGGALEFLKIINEINPKNETTVSETDTLIYACRVTEIGTVNIQGQKNLIIFTTLPENKSIERKVHGIYPQFRDVHEPLMGIHDSPVLHICGMIFNSDRIRRKEKFNFYTEGFTPELVRYAVEMDRERCDVSAALGMAPLTIHAWYSMAYGVSLPDFYTTLQNIPAYKNTPDNPCRSPAPQTLEHRYLTEEVLFRAIPTIEIAKIFGIKMPKYEEVVRLATRLTGIDFAKKGRKISDIGLTPDIIKNWDSRDQRTYMGQLRGYGSIR